MVSPKYYQRLARRLLVDHLATAVRELNQQMTIPTKLAELLIDQASFSSNLELMAERALQDGCTKTNPHSVTKVQLQQLYQSIYIGSSVDF